MESAVLSRYRRIGRWPAGNWLLARAVYLKVPYFSGIATRITKLEPGRCEGWIRHRRRVSNHLGTIHTGALCNLAERVGGLMVEAALPASVRWIPENMDVRYLGKVRGTRHAIATPSEPICEDAHGDALPRADP